MDELVELEDVDLADVLRLGKDSVGTYRPLAWKPGSQVSDGIRQIGSALQARGHPETERSKACRTHATTTDELLTVKPLVSRI